MWKTNAQESLLVRSTFLCLILSAAGCSDILINGLGTNQNASISAEDFSPDPIVHGQVASIILPHTVEGAEANRCEVYDLENLVLRSPCECGGGVCSVGLEAAANYTGQASFVFTVSLVDNEGEIIQSSDPALANVTIVPSPTAPVTADIFPASFNEDTPSTITLSYSDDQGDLASSCTVTELINVTESSACSCNGAGVCTVGLTGLADYFGPASFSYRVTANLELSDKAAATLNIDPVEDAPVAGNISPAAFNEDTESVITLSYSDAESDLATACSVSSLSNVTETTACSCTGSGVCTVGVTGTSHYNGAANFDYTVTANAELSNVAAATLSISAVDDAPVADNISPTDFEQDTESIITLSYSDAESQLATACSVGSLSNITESTACSCNGGGVCTVGVTGTASYTGAASFTYTVTANSLVSNSATASFNIFASGPSEQKITAADGATNDYFGDSVAISSNTLIVGAWGDSDNGGNSGSAYIYRLDPDTNTWAETKITASDGAASDYFGGSVAISGNTVVVGADGDDDTMMESGSVYVYQLDPSTNLWMESKLTASDSQGSAQLGQSVAVSGHTVVAGAPYAEGSDEGAVYLFRLDPVSNTWLETKLTASDASANAYFGSSVAISENTVIVGAYNESLVASAAGAAYIYRLYATTDAWEETKLVASDGAASDWFGDNVAIFGNTALVSAEGDDDNGAESGSAYIYRLDPGLDTWAETKITASDGAANDKFGISLALSGHTAVIGASSDDDNGFASGSAYVYQLDPVTNTWLETKLIASDGAANDNLGSSVGVWGNSVLVGASWDDMMGSAYFYDLTTSATANGDWSETKLLASDGVGADFFGMSVAISNNTLIVGSWADDDNGDASGSAYIYRFDPDTGAWVETKLVASDGAAGDNFARSVGVSGDNVIVSADQDQDNGAGSGSAYIYRLDPDSNTWVETKLTASDGTASDRFGYRVAIDGNKAIVGAFNDSNGSAYIYRLHPLTNTWMETKLTASDGAPGDRFGYGIALSGDSAVVGASYDDDNGAESGSAYIYRLDPDTSTWEETKITASDGAADDRFASEVGISGNSVIVGSYRDDDNGAESGSAYIYRLDRGSNTWVETKITASDGAAGDNFGVSVAILDDTAIVGATYDADNGVNSGSAYIYRLDPGSNTWEETKITASDGAASDYFGTRVAISSFGAIVGAYGDSDNGSSSGSAYIYDFEY